MPLPNFARPRIRRRPFLRCSAGTLAVLALTISPALAAQAHVQVHPESTLAGGDTPLTFTVPSESDTAGTTKLTITLPQDPPFVKVAARSMPGWTIALVTADLPAPVPLDGTTLTTAVRTVTWTAKPGFEISPQQYENFDLTVGPLPESGEIGFTARQTYADGSVVDWDEPISAGAVEPDHPAASFTVTPAADLEDETGAEDEVPPVATSESLLTRWSAGSGLLAGLAALGLSVARRSPRRLPPGPGNRAPNVTTVAAPPTP